MALGFVLLAVWSTGYVESRAFQTDQSRSSMLPGARSRRAPRLPFRRAPDPWALTSSPMPKGGVLGRIEIPRLGIRAMIAEGSDDRTLRHAVGHLVWTALPGRAGTAPSPVIVTPSFAGSETCGQTT
jgi:sortase (surface protein transpeptidase)